MTSAASLDLAAELKKQIDSAGCVEDTLTVAQELDVPHESVVGVANSLCAKG